MSRRHRAEKREINPDPKFGDTVVTKFMNAIMLDGKKSAAERIVYGAFEQVEDKLSEEFLAGNFGPGDTIYVDVKDDEITLRVEAPAPV